MGKTELVKVSKVEEIALSKINQYIDLGMALPEGFNPVNSLKKARLMLNDMKVNGKPVLEVCSEASIVQCLIESCCKGLDYSESQVYFIPRGNAMTNLESVYGRIARAKRASKNYKPIVQYVHEGDKFEMGVNTETGQTFIKTHEITLENLDKPIIAAYTYVTDNNGNTDVFIMTKREWLTSWKKSPNGCAVAKEFERDMIYRTIIKKSTKALVNSNVNSITFANEEDDDAPLGGDGVNPKDFANNAHESIQDVDFEDMSHAEDDTSSSEEQPNDTVDTQTGELFNAEQTEEKDF